MIVLDYNQAQKYYILKIPRYDEEFNPQMLMREHGLMFSTTASTRDEAVLFTTEPYAAAAFGDFATSRAISTLRSTIAYDDIAASWKPDSQINVKCPADRELWGFQKADLEYALRRRNTLLGDQPGLGKTPTAICFANEIGAKRVLVICPASIRLQWVKRIREWTTMRYPFIIHPILHSRNGVHPTAQWTVVSYDLCRTGSIGKRLAEGRYDLVIIDEAHYLKTIDSHRTRAIFGGGSARDFAPIADRAERILALTGTPLPNRPREAYTLARGMCFDAIDWLSEEGFTDRFNPSLRIEKTDPKTGQTKFYIDERSGRHAELQNRLRANFMIRHLKRDVMPQLHLPVYDIIQLEETAAVRQALKAESLLDIDPENLEGADAEILGHVAVVRRMMGIALAPQVCDYVATLLDGGEEKIVLFAWHIEVLNIIEERLRKYGVVRIDGSISSTQKEKRKDLFIAEPGIRVIAGNILSMGTGVDGLQDVCSHAVIGEPDWTPGNNIQAFDRLDRGGQRETVQGDICVAPGSFAERILASALRKLQTTHKALDKRYMSK